MNPLLDKLSLPRFSEIGPEHMEGALDRGIAEHRATVAAVVAGGNGSFADFWLPLERAATAIDGLCSAVLHLHSVAVTSELRAEYKKGQQRKVENSLTYLQNRDMYDVLVAMSERPDFADQLVAARRFLSGMFIVRQIEFGLFDLLLHLGTMGSDPMEVIEAARDGVAVVRPPEWHRFPHAFSRADIPWDTTAISGLRCWLPMAFSVSGTPDSSTGPRQHSSEMKCCLAALAARPRTASRLFADANRTH
jgi:Zn-dependent oligopeptidases